MVIPLFLEIQNLQYGKKKKRLGMSIKRILWYALVRTLKPSVIIESGVHRGLGTCVLSAAITKNRAEGFKGDLYAVDIDPKAGELVQSPYKDVVKLTIQDSLDYLKTFDKLNENTITAVWYF